MTKKLIALAIVIALSLNLLTGCSIEKPSKMETPPVSVLESVDYHICTFLDYSTKVYKTLVYNYKSINIKCYGTSSEALDNPKQLGLKYWNHYSQLGYCFKELDVQLLLKNVTKVEKITPTIITGPDKGTIKVDTELDIDDIYRATININVPAYSTSLYKVLFEITYRQEDSLEHCFFAISFYSPK